VPVAWTTRSMAQAGRSECLETSDAKPSTAIWDAVLAQTHWHFIDGVALLFAAAILAPILL
jgi:hypothetical protein